MAALLPSLAFVAVAIAVLVLVRNLLHRGIRTSLAEKRIPERPFGFRRSAVALRRRRSDQGARP